MSSADRKRRYRRRQRLGLEVIPLEIDAGALAIWLEARGALDPEDCSNAGLARALARLVHKGNASLG